MKTRKKKVPEFNSKFWDFFNASRDKRFVINVGGAGSGKSFSTAQWLIKKLFEETKKKFLVVRKTFPSLQLTAMQLILDLLQEYNLPYDLNRQAPVTLRAHGNEMIFRGLDDPEKVKSFDPNYVWMEEASDFRRKDFTQLNLRLRRPNDLPNQIFMSLNPVDKLFSWIYDKFFEHIHPRAAILNSTWMDNYKNLDNEYIEELEALIDEDETTYQIYTLGLWGVLKNIIYNNWDNIPNFPAVLGDRFYGLDFGYSQPMALVECRYIDAEIYEKELIYSTHLTTPELIEKLKVFVPNRNDTIYADSAEPSKIQEVRLAGFNIKPARKDVKHGIDFVKRLNCHIVNGSPNLEKEKKGYKYKEDKDGNILEEPVKWADHLMDGERYAIFTHLFKLLRPIILRKKLTKQLLGAP